MKKVPDFQVERVVLVLVDMQQESSPEGFWGATDWEETVEAAARVLQCFREQQRPVVHVRVARDPSGVDCHPYDLRDENGRPVYSARGTPGVEFHPLLEPWPGEPVVEKQRFTAFYQTNLELVLSGFKAQHLVMLGVFTEACFLTSVYDAFFRGHTISIVKDACTAATRAAHRTSMLDMANWIYGCSIFTSTQLVRALNGEPYQAWFWERPNARPYRLEDVDALYQALAAPGQDAEKVRPDVAAVMDWTDERPVPADWDDQIQKTGGNVE